MPEYFLWNSAVKAINQNTKTSKANAVLLLLVSLFVCVFCFCFLCVLISLLLATIICSCACWTRQNGQSVSTICGNQPFHFHDVAWNRPIKVRNLKPWSLFVFVFALACERTFITTHNTESRCYRSENYTVLQARLCMFQPGNFTGWSSERVKEEEEEKS